MKTYHIYTDGSHFKNGGSGRLGIGGVLIDPNKNLPRGEKLNSFSMEINKDYLSVHYGTEDCSNPTMEMMAVLVALEEFKDTFKAGDKIKLMADYEGVKYWLEGKWQAKKDYIRKLKEEILSEIKSQNLDIEFVWVKGHQRKTGEVSNEAYWNSEVDKLAKGDKK